MKKFNAYQQSVIISFVLLVVFWAFLFVTNHHGGTWNYWYSLLFGLIPFFGGIVGMFKTPMWGGFKSTLGRAIFFVSFGLFLWGSGSIIWSYYNFFKHVPAPYPSLADIGYAPSIFFWVLGTVFLSVATGAFFELKRTRRAKVFVILVPLLLLVPSYYIQVTIAKGGTLVPAGDTALKAVLDIAYPFGDFLALTFAAIVYGLSRRYFGGLYRNATLYLLLGLAVMYCADSVFSYTTTKGTYYNADWGDMLLTIGQTLMTLGILAFATKPAVTKLVKAVASVANPMDVYGHMAVKIIQAQEVIMGPIAVERAQLVEALKIDWVQHKINILGNPQSAIDELVDKYKELLGEIAVQTCKESASYYTAQLSADQLPKSLQ